MADIREIPQNPFLPSQIIELADATELPAFEDMVAATIRPNMTTRQQADWDYRPKLGDMLKPRKFNGSLIDIQLEPFADPYESLVNAPHEGWKLLGGNLKRTGIIGAETIPFFRGFLLTANARSSHKGIRGHIRTAIWYGLRPAQGINQNGTIKVNSTMSVCPIKRYVARPEYDPDQFRKIHKDARRIGFQVLRQQMRQTITAPNRS